MDKYVSQKLLLEASEENLLKVKAFLDSFLIGLGFSDKAKRRIHLAVEEIFINIASYAYYPEVGEAEIHIMCVDDPPGITISMADGGKPYDPLKQPDPDVTISAEERQIGGLGIFLVKTYVDGIRYEYKEGKNVLTIRKNLHE